MITQLSQAQRKGASAVDVEEYAARLVALQQLTNPLLFSVSDSLFAKALFYLRLFWCVAPASHTCA